MENQADSDKENIKLLAKEKDRIKDRIKSFDIFKGFAIFWIVVGHIANYWLIRSDIWIYEVLLTFVFRCITGLNFILLIGVNLAISFNSKREKGWTEKRIWIHNLKRVGILFLLSIIYNIVIELIRDRLGLASLWSWYILQCIAISIIILILLNRIPNISKILLGVIFIFISHPLYYYLPNLGDFGLIIQRFLYYPYEQYPILPWISATLFGWVVGDFFYKTKYKKNKKLFNNNEEFKKLLLAISIIGMVLISIGLVFGNKYPSSINPYDDWWYKLGLSHTANLHNNPIFLSIPNIPYFLLEGHWSSMIYGVGVIFVCLGILTYICDYKKHNNFIFNSLAFAGKFSFSIFLYHHVGILLFPNTFNIIWIWVAVPTYTILFIFLIWIIVKKFNAVGLIEWIMVIITYDVRDKESEK
ncbi:MAG: DUF1624 domain-containing protein [Promethearchaeota archaeon]|nr:MAG: DUF1624 domain-containing protein [Candidatus Lokiarchaeota archaeon]